MVLGHVDLPVSRPLSDRDLTILGIRLPKEWPHRLVGVLVESHGGLQGGCLWLESGELVVKGRPGQEQQTHLGFVSLCCPQV